MHDVGVGLAIGVVQSLVGHPLDTVKILLQNGQPFRTLRPLQLYRGVSYPTMASLVFNATTFPVFSHLRRRNYNPYAAGAVAGVSIAPINFMFNVGKIRRQTLTPKPLHTKGIGCSFARSVLSMAVYFGVYSDLSPSYGPLAAGAVAGLANWTLTYPLDAVATRQIAGNLNVGSALSLGPLTRGYIPCALRAVVVNSTSFYMYEYLQ